MIERWELVYPTENKTLRSIKLIPTVSFTGMILIAGGDASQGVPGGEILAGC
jgi:hypothetical protein